MRGMLITAALALVLIGATLPAVVQKSLRESLELEHQLEALLAGKMLDKGEKNKK